jgi:hypothetical protein
MPQRRFQLPEPVVDDQQAGNGDPAVKRAGGKGCAFEHRRRQPASQRLHRSIKVCLEGLPLEGSVKSRPQFLQRRRLAQQGDGEQGLGHPLIGDKLPEDVVQQMDAVRRQFPGDGRQHGREGALPGITQRAHFRRTEGGIAQAGRAPGDHVMGQACSQV